MDCNHLSLFRAFAIDCAPINSSDRFQCEKSDRINQHYFIELKNLLHFKWDFSKIRKQSPAIFQFIEWKRTTAAEFRYFYIRLCSLREQAFIVLLTWYNCSDLWMFKESTQLNVITSARTEPASELPSEWRVGGGHDGQCNVYAHRSLILHLSKASKRQYINSACNNWTLYNT